ncbi:MAG: hypothetical protein GF398_09255 [Chitinivibrionales bacterium]|nr:hypothetical protein [Chitinivibrionales bacterium]
MRKFFRSILLVIILFHLAVIEAKTGYNLMKYNTIRIASVDWFSNLSKHESDFLPIVKQMGYNYIFALFKVQKLSKMQEVFERAFILSEKHELRLIPCISLISCYSSSWSELGKQYPDFEMNLIEAKNRNGDISLYGMPSLVGEERSRLGVDSAFCDVIRTLKRAHRNSKAKYPLEFIHLGVDEPFFYNYCLIGGVPNGKIRGKGFAILNNSHRQFSFSDRAYIRDKIKKSQTASSAFQSLIVLSLFKKIHLLHRNLNSNIKIMLWADIWDPQQNGKGIFDYHTKLVTFLGSKRVVKFTPGIISLPGLSEQQKKIFKDNTILIPWEYFNKTKINETLKYDETETFRLFSSHGFKFLYAHTIYSFDNFNSPSSQKQGIEWHNASLRFKSHCLGYHACWFGKIGKKAIESLRFTSEVNSSHIPEKAFFENTDK